MTTSRLLFIPIILGTPRQGRMSEHVAAFMKVVARNVIGVCGI